MGSTVGFVGTVKVETVDTSRIWFSLTDGPTGDDWIHIGARRAWFTMNLEDVDRAAHLAQLTLLMEALRSGCQVKADHGGSASFHYNEAGDAFEVTGLRMLRPPLRF